MGSTSSRSSPAAVIPDGRTVPAIEVRDVAPAWGVTRSNRYGGAAGKKFILEMTGNGAAIFDFDRDGRLDIVLANGPGMDQQPASAVVVYRNEGTEGFRDVTDRAAPDLTGWAQGICAGDFDGDGFTDLFVTYYGQNRLLRNHRGERLQDVTANSGLEYAPLRFGTGCTFLDFDHDGLLDIAVANYLQFDIDKSQQPGAGANCVWKGLNVFCGPRGFPGGAVWLYRNKGEGRFEDVTEKAGLSLSGLYYALGVLSADFNGDGWPDLYVAADSTPSLLFLNKGDGTFEESGVAAGVAYGADGQEQGSMGVASLDFDRNGLPDLMVTNFIDETSALYRNEGDGFFLDSTVASGVGYHTGFVGWGVVPLDFDLDGWPDLLINNGHIYPELEKSTVGEAYRQRKILYWNLGDGRFVDVTAKIGGPLMRPAPGRGLALGDLDGDGIPEVLSVHQNEAPAIYKFAGARGTRLVVALEGTQSNRSAIGARVTVHTGETKQSAQVLSGSSYLSQNDFRLYFGLGSASKVDVLEVAWPGGKTERYTDLSADAVVEIREAEGIVKTTALPPIE